MAKFSNKIAIPSCKITVNFIKEIGTELEKIAKDYTDEEIKQYEKYWEITLKGREEKIESEKKRLNDKNLPKYEFVLPDNDSKYTFTGLEEFESKKIILPLSLEKFTLMLFLPNKTIYLNFNSPGGRNNCDGYIEGDDRSWVKEEKEKIENMFRPIKTSNHLVHNFALQVAVTIIVAIIFWIILLLKYPWLKDVTALNFLISILVWTVLDALKNKFLPYIEFSLVENQNQTVSTIAKGLIITVFIGLLINLLSPFINRVLSSLL